MTADLSLRAYVAEAKFECIRALRAPGFSAPTLLLPAMLYLFFGVVLAQASRSEEIDRFIFTGFTVMGVIGPGLFGFGVFVAVEREQGLLKLKRALPMPPASYLLAKMFMTLLFAMLVTLTVIGAALAAGKVVVSGSQLTALVAIVVAGALPFCAIGLLIGSWAGGRSAPAFVNLLYLPMIYLSGFLIPLPTSIAAIQYASPAYHLDRLALWALGAPVAGVTVHLAVLALVTVVGATAALRRLAAAD
jgi:ABC-2 type transport system permease protein